jgi:hypothetical protein
MWKSKKCEKLWGIKICFGKMGILDPIFQRNLSFCLSKKRKDKMIVEKQKIFQQSEKSGRISVF